MKEECSANLYKILKEKEKPYIREIAQSQKNNRKEEDQNELRKKGTWTVGSYKNKTNANIQLSESQKQRDELQTTGRFIIETTY